jgi:hypothetical protein
MSRDASNPSTLYPNHGEIGQDTATATGRQILPQGIAESNFGKVETSKLYITGTSFHCQSRAIKSKPSAIAHVVRQFLHLLGRVKRSLTGFQFPETREFLCLNSGNPIPRQQRTVSSSGQACG